MKWRTSSDVEAIVAAAIATMLDLFQRTLNIGAVDSAANQAQMELNLSALLRRFQPGAFAKALTYAMVSANDAGSVQVGGAPVSSTSQTASDIAAYADSIRKVSAADQLQAVVESMKKAVDAGQTFGAWKEKALAGEVELGLPESVKSTTLRTNVQMAYNAGRYVAQKADVASKPIWRYSAINESKTCETHREMSGFMAPADDPIWSVWYPPAGYNCRCHVDPLTQAEAEAAGYMPGQAVPNVQPDPGFGFNSSARGLGQMLHEVVSARPATLSSGLLQALDSSLGAE